MSGLSCQKCAAPMAMADKLCSQCGAPAPAGAAALLLAQRAEQAYAAGRLEEAVAQLQGAIITGLPLEQLALAWRKLGVWLEKAGGEMGRPDMTARAGEAFKSAFGLNDADAIAHQLFIANRAKLGLLGQASEFYKKRLELDGQDAVAQKQLAVIKLSADFLAAPRPVAAAMAPTTLEKWLKPRPWKVAMAGSTFLSSVGAMFYMALGHAQALPAATSAASDDLGAAAAAAMPASVDAMIHDPAIWAFQAGLSGLALYFMYRNR